MNYLGRPCILEFLESRFYGGRSYHLSCWYTKKEFGLSKYPQSRFMLRIKVSDVCFFITGAIALAAVPPAYFILTRQITKLFHLKTRILVYGD
ncbi:hypothetical protein ZYGR_0R00110 [Zygosaccharomyces rouxii]|uniref:Uncharacterized protein n=1 Tax=Zygosaccharomyces rouxii TaxID=4956 RepID=A0A1Q3A2E6_ZYGRO|nr:hypothetical protein ZYGR_0R00110 [Zygosaccharomyces rouxii]